MGRAARCCRRKRLPHTGRHLHRLLVAVCLLSLTATAVSAQDDLSWGFQPGDVFYVREVVEEDRTVSVTAVSATAEAPADSGPESGPDSGNTRREQKKTVQTTLTRFAVQDVLADGTVEFEMAIESVVDEGGKTTDIGKRIAGSQFSLTVDRRGEVTRFGGYDEFIRRVAKGNVQFARLFQSILSEETLKDTFGQILTVVPNRPVDEGQSWTQKQLLSIGPFGAMAVSRTFTHKGITQRDGVPTVDLALAGKAEYIPPSGEETGLPFTVTDGKLRVDEMRGTGWFDLQRRRLGQLEVSLKVSGTLTMKIGQQVAEFTIEQTQSSRVTLHDTRPAASSE